MGTAQEVDWLVAHLGLVPGQRVLDVGCGPGRHARALAERGLRVLGVDVSAEFVALAREGAPPGAEFVVGDARELDHDGEFDLVLSACQGAFGLLGREGDDVRAGGEGDDGVFARMARAVRPGGHLVVDTFSAAFVLRHLEAGEEYDVARGVLHEVATVRGPGGDERPFDLWTTCWTPRELRLLAERAGLAVVGVHASAPGRWGSGLPAIDAPGVLLVARRSELV